MIRTILSGTSKPKKLVRAFHAKGTDGNVLKVYYVLICCNVKSRLVLNVIMTYFFNEIVKFKTEYTILRDLNRLIVFHSEVFLNSLLTTVVTKMICIFVVIIKLTWKQIIEVTPSFAF